MHNLLNSGVTAERLMRYGLEYRHITRYLLQQCSYQEMFDNLFTDIRHFSKRQMTWFRRMQRNGVEIVWLDGQKSLPCLADEVVALCHERLQPTA